MDTKAEEEDRAAEPDQTKQDVTNLGSRQEPEGKSVAEPVYITKVKQYFPMWVIPVETCRTLERFEMHETMMAQGKLVEWRQGMGSAAFISHTWLSNMNPDPTGIKLGLLKRVLDQILTGEMSIPRYWLQEIYYGAELIPGTDLKRAMQSGFVWFDYPCIPQTNAEQMRLACDSIPWYIRTCDFFMILVPTAFHMDSLELFDLRMWKKRGWPRAERLYNELSLKPKPTIIIESNSSVYTVPSAEWLSNPVGHGIFTVDSDKAWIGSAIRGVVEERKSQAIRDGDMISVRILESLTAHFVAGTGLDLLPQFPMKAWMQVMGFKSAADGIESGWTPLRFAIYADRLDIARELLVKKADVHAPLTNPAPMWGLHRAKSTILHGICSLYDSPAAVTFLLEHRADPSLKDEEGYTPIRNAAFHGFNGACVAILAVAPQTALIPCACIHGYYPWMAATMRGKPDTLKLFINNYPDLVTNDLNLGDAYDGGPCHSAIIDAGDAECLQLCIAYGFNVNKQARTQNMLQIGVDTVTLCEQRCEATDWISTECCLFMGGLEGNAPIMSAAFFGNLSCARLLIAGMADLSLTNKYNRDALIIAAMRGHEEIVKELLNAGMRSGLQDTQGLTAKQWASKRGHNQIVTLLEVDGPEGHRRADFMQNLVFGEQPDQNIPVELAQQPTDVCGCWRPNFWWN